MRVAIIGTGHVGLACAHSLLIHHVTREIVLVGHDEAHARGEALDLQQAVPVDTPMKVMAGTYADAATADVVIFAAGQARFVSSRLEMLTENAAIVRECVGALAAHGFAGVLIMATNPVDAMTAVAADHAGVPAGQVIGTGTLLDSQRLRVLIADEFDLDARSVHAAVIGEHGDSSVSVWSGAQISGVPLAEYDREGRIDRGALADHVRRAGPEVEHLKGNTCYAIAACVGRIVRAVLRDERTVLPVSTRLEGQYGLEGVVLSTPCIVGAGGVEQILELPLSDDEARELRLSAAILREAEDAVRVTASS